MVLLGHVDDLGLADHHLMDGLDLVLEGEGLPLLELALLLRGPDVLLNCGSNSVDMLVHPLRQLVDLLLISLNIISSSRFSSLLSRLKEVLTILCDSLGQLLQLVTTQLVISEL